MEEIPHTSDKESLNVRKEEWLSDFHKWVKSAGSDPPKSLTRTTSFFRQQPRTLPNVPTHPPIEATTGRRALLPREGVAVGALQCAPVVAFRSALGGQQSDTGISLNSNAPGFLPGLSENETALQVVAKVCAYFAVSSTRVTDNVTMYIIQNFLHALPGEIQDHFKNEVRNMKEDDCRRYGVDDPDDQQDRDILNARKSILTSVINTLSRLQE